MTQNPYTDLPTTPAPPVGGSSDEQVFAEEPAPAYPAPAATYPRAPQSSTQDAEGVTAKDQAQQLGQGAADAGKQVTGAAKDQAREVAGEAKAQARDLLGQARSEAQDQAENQKQRVTQGLYSIGRELDSMAGGSQEQGLATDLARQGSQAARDAAAWLDDRDPGALLGEVRTFARRRPAAFLGIALAAGVVAGRLARGLKDSDGEGAPTSTTRSNPASGPTPGPLDDPLDHRIGDPMGDPIRQDLR